MIRILSADLTNKIAAGEVVERPASVVKELLENAIDAGASQVSIDISGGGLTRISLTDNGSGMNRSDAVLALERHATSKLQEESDLFAIKTLGFRGEALPSIASVSHFCLLTRRQDDLAGTKVRVNQGVITAEDAAAPKGTQVIVEDLFYNTPARLKFMKSVAAEGSHILNVALSLALSRPDVAIECTRDDRLVLSTPGNGKLDDVIRAVYGHDVMQQLLPLVYSEGEYRISGYIGKPTFSRSNRRDEHFVINGRYAQARNIQHAVEEAYRQIMPPRKYPFFVLSIQLPLEQVDVNVHPAKTEVRFREEAKLYQLCLCGVRSALNPQLLGKEAEQTVVYHPPQQSEDWLAAETTATARPTIRQESLLSSFPMANQRAATAPQARLYAAPDELTAASRSEESGQVLPPQNPQFSALDLKQPSIFPPMRVISQLAGTYLLAQSIDAFYLFDQHAAHERILFGMLKAQMEQGQISSQTMLMPYTIELPVMEFDRIIQRLAELRTLGFLLEDFGNQTLLVREMPQLLTGDGAREGLVEIFNELTATERPLSASDLTMKTLITMSCKGAIKANQWLPQNRMSELIEQLGRTENAATCPHGRPTFYCLSLTDLDKIFKRVTP
ncbi:MAG: DNA mismatch repair endonuclease MutL [Negativicutes bacterium]|nr:DNA mismatch repair endonuclease MutL [Negativicutes bacterium]